jgi:hypothetical protein
MPDSVNHPRRLPPRQKTSRRPTGRDYLSELPFELFLPIVKYIIDNNSSKPLASLKSLSSCNKAIRGKCISSGLFKSLLVNLHRGHSSIRQILQRLLHKTPFAFSIPAFSIHSLTITVYIIGECPSELAKLLELLPQLRIFRIKGNRQTESSISWDSLPPLNCGRLVSFDSLLYKTLSSKPKLLTLERLEIIDCSVTQVLMDIIAATRSYTRLVWTRSHLLHKPDVMQHAHCKVRTVHFNGTRFGDERWMGRFLSYARISAHVEYMSLPERLLEFVFGDLGRLLLVFPTRQDIFPKLRTVHVLPTPFNASFRQDGAARHHVIAKTMVWRVPSFLRYDDALLYVSPLLPLHPYAR